ncbi:MAG: DUF1294 domain-containing protein [Steroidobacteraceae bacterium]
MTLARAQRDRSPDPAAFRRTLFAYAWDKNSAMTRRWRTQEQTLHMLEQFGGWPGAWIAQKTLRHKSSKLSFQIEIWLCVVVNIAVLTWYAAGQSGGN